MGYRYKKNFLELVPIPPISENEQRSFVEIVDKIYEITSNSDYDSENPPEEQRTLEEEIDQMVYQIYGLTREEIKFVEESINS